MFLELHVLHVLLDMAVQFGEQAPYILEEPAYCLFITCKKIKCKSMQITYIL
jgi:hypothetical protein